MLHERFAEAWINRRDHRCLGRRLHPFCLYDIFALELIASPFLDLANAGRIEWADLRLAVRICSAHPGAALDPDFFQTSGIREIVSALWYRLSGRKANRGGGTAALIRAECDRFSAYQADFYSLPSWCEGEDRPAKISWLLLCAARILRTTGVTEDNERRVWSMPVGKLIWYGTAFGVLDGADEDLISPEEEAAMQEMGL